MMQQITSTSLSASSYLYAPSTPDWLSCPNTPGAPPLHVHPSLTGLIRRDSCNYPAVTAVELAPPPAPTRLNCTTWSRERLEMENFQLEGEFSFSPSFLIFQQISGSRFFFFFLLFTQLVSCFSSAKAFSSVCWAK